ncbi:hypothetical protein BDY21DRAFT_94606 [Lineolata rhizophorae]|uniref:Uncharacterized protein n=1 Tax=Lineolata rhizophorae TaxID=578093 RepID=A0A6A6NSR5_9PEZI|nr:hypothetical protein BDY21DRAFT_94606 [Lineolata rhizophorae]
MVVVLRRFVACFFMLLLFFFLTGTDCFAGHGQLLIHSGFDSAILPLASLIALAFSPLLSGSSRETQLLPSDTNVFEFYIAFRLALASPFATIRAFSPLRVYCCWGSKFSNGNEVKAIGHWKSRDSSTENFLLLLRNGIFFFFGKEGFFSVVFDIEGNAKTAPRLCVCTWPS